MNSRSKKILIVTHTYLPEVKTGTFRVLGFAKHLKELGWEPLVLTVKRKNGGNGRSGAMSDGYFVKRTLAFDAKKAFAIKGQTLDILTIPDAFASWCLTAVPCGRAMVKSFEVDIVLSTYPIATSHLVGHWICKTTGTPWVADFRDPMLQDDYPANELTRKSWKWLEKRIAKYADRLLFTTRSSCEYYMGKYAGLNRKNCRVVANGYMESDFDRLPCRTILANSSGKIRIVHAGTLYSEERNPAFLFRGIRKSIDENRIKKEDLVLELYGSGSSGTVDGYRKEVRKLGLARTVEFHPSVPHARMIDTMGQADILLVLQDKCCDMQIPAKIYEYFKIGKPILALTPRHGETGMLVNRCGAGLVAPLDDPEEIADVLSFIVEEYRSGRKLPSICSEKARRFERSEQAKELSSILDELV